MKKAFIIFGLLTSSLFASPIPRCETEVSLLTSTISKVSFKKDAERVVTDFKGHVGMHIKKYETRITLSDNALVRYESHVLEYDHESANCEVLHIRRK